MIHSKDKSGYGMYLAETKIMKKFQISSDKVCGWGGDGTNSV